MPTCESPTKIRTEEENRKMSLAHVTASPVPHVRFNGKSMDYIRFSVHAMLPQTHSTNSDG